MTSLAEVKAQRREEAERAAETLGAEIEFFDAGDYPLHTTPEMLDRLVNIYRELKPSFVLTHSLEDPYNVDHPEAMRASLRKPASSPRRQATSRAPTSPTMRRPSSCSSRTSPSSATTSQT